jgi:hypothetical protein
MHDLNQKKSDIEETFGASIEYLKKENKISQHNYHLKMGAHMEERVKVFHQYINNKYL